MSGLPDDVHLLADRGGTVGCCPYCEHPRSPDTTTAHVVQCENCGFIAPLSKDLQSLAHEAWPENASALHPGQVLRERYRIVAFIGSGAHGLTYFAQHEFLNHPCVVKILPYRVKDPSDAAVRRLTREAQTGFRVNDPHVVRVLDCDEIEGMWYFVMEYVDGVDLAAVISAGLRVCWPQAARLMADAARGLAAIHRAGLLHRDIKPANLLLGVDGRLRITDLGIVGLARHGDGTDGPNPLEAVGTLDYAAPELLEPGAGVGVQADLYALGATIYHAVTGRLPHADKSVFQALIDAHSRVARWPDDALPEVPDWFVDVVLRLLANQADQRFPSAEALCNYVQRQLGRSAPAAVDPPPSQAMPPRGLAVLPFENESPAATDDWLGFALADSLSRELARSPGVYLADPSQLRAVLARQTTAGQAQTGEALLAAGRLVGAATVATGRFGRLAEWIRVWVDVHRQGQSQPVRIGPLEGPLSRLVELQAEMLDRVSELLQLRAATRVEGTATAPALETREKFSRGKQAYLQGDYETAIRLAREAIAQDPQLTEAVQYMAACHARLGQYEEAARHHRELMDLAEQRGDKRLLSEVLANLGVMHYFKGEYQIAHSHYARAAALANELNLATESAQIHNNAGFALFHLGKPREAEAAFRQAVDTFRAFGALAALIGPYNGLGRVLAQQGRYDEARDYHRRALALAQEIGDRTNTGVAQMHLGHCASSQGDFSEAKTEFALALSALEGTSFWNVLALTYEFMADMNLRLGHLSEAVRCAEQRIELARRHANRTMEAAAWRQKAQALDRIGRTAEADVCLKRADDVGT